MYNKPLTPNQLVDVANLVKNLEARVQTLEEKLAKPAPKAKTPRKKSANKKATASNTKKEAVEENTSNETNTSEAQQDDETKSLDATGAAISEKD